jgi:hypothetical protein
MKRCAKCEIEFPSTPEFFHRSGKNGLQARCKQCRNQQLRHVHATDTARRIRQHQTTKNYVNRLRMETMTIYCGGQPQCQCCGESHIEFLSLDHVNNDGNIHRMEIGLGGSRLYHWAKKHGFPPTLQVLCSNCNWAKSRYGQCPHKREPESIDKNNTQCLSRMSAFPTAKAGGLSADMELLSVTDNLF